MIRRKRTNYTAADRQEMWDRWHRGESIREIGRAFDRAASSVRCYIGPYGGIEPPPRKRSSISLTTVEREEISRGIAADLSLRTIAAKLGRSPSTVSREIARNGGSTRYRAARADKAAWKRAKRPKPCKLAGNRALCRTVSVKLTLNWSPEQIAGWLKKHHPGDESNQVSHETIYRSLFVQTRGVLKKELQQHLRTRRAIRRSKHASFHNKGRGEITNAVSIRERPAAVEDRAVPGHWEGDLIAGTGNSHIATLVERHSRYVMLVKVKDKKTETVVAALIKQSKKLPSELYKSLTWDRGNELAHHEKFTLDTNIKVYFCDPRSPWQRGTNENTNRLLRQYYPKGTNLSTHSQKELNAVARQLNERPRKTLEYDTPAKVFNRCVASTN